MDIVQELFLHIWENKEKFEAMDNPKAYLMTSVRNRCMNKLTRQKHQINDKEYLDEFLTSDDNVIESIEAKETEKSLNQLIDQLPAKCKEIFVLSRFERMNYKDIASVLNLSIKTVEHQISHALKFLRKHSLLLYILVINEIHNI